MDNRVVLTPGHSVTIPVRIVRAEPDPEHPVQLTLTGGGAAGVFVSLDTTNTKADLATLSIGVTPAATPQEVSYALAGKLGLHDDLEALVVSVQIADEAAATTEEYAPGVAGVWKKLTIAGQELDYEVINGVAIIGGDIVLGEEQEVLARLRLRSGTCNPMFHTDFACAAWTNGVIGYTIANNWGDDNEYMNMNIAAAMREWTRQTGIRFVPRTSGERVQFENGDGCSAGVGRVVLTGIDPQKVSISNRCDYGRVLHEIGHAIGLYHEQQRRDRGSFVSINWGRIQEDKSGNFFQIGDYIVDRGRYDYDSIMHYEPWAFAKNRAACEDEGDLNECTILPTNPSTAVIGQRDHLSEGDIHGVYKLYPPVFSIGGAANGQTVDRVRLHLDYERGRPEVDRVVWRSDRVPTPLGTGNVIEIRSDQVPAGTNVITARFIVRGEVLRSESITLNFHNEEPVVEVIPVNGRLQQEMNQTFSVVVSVNDAEDGACGGCTFTWDPVPTTGPVDTRTAAFSFSTPGTRTVRVTVEDLGGARTTAGLTVQIVDSPPTVTIARPTEGLTVADNTILQLAGSGTDTNTGALPCTSLTWSSSNPADVFTSGTTGCTKSLKLVGVGPRTITLTGTDGVNTSTDTANIVVQSSACTAEGCPPYAYFELPEPNLPNGTYLIEREMEFVVWVGDVDVHSPIRYVLYARRAGTTTPIIRITPSEQIELVTSPEQRGDRRRRVDAVQRRRRWLDELHGRYARLRSRARSDR